MQNTLTKGFLLMVMIFLSASLYAQEKLTISGYIKNAASGEEQIGASIYVKELGNGTTSNAYGFYSLTLPKGKYTLVTTYIGFETLTKTVELSENVKLNFEIVEKSNQLKEVIVKADKPEDNVENIEMSVNKLDIKTIQKMPALLGEVDLIKSIQLLPGVATVGEGASGFNVRGGSIDQNLVLLDEAPVYNSSHLFGFFSVFNPDAVKNINLVKGGIPAQFGGRLSSILDVRMKEGNEKEITTSGGIGLIFSRLSIEGPIAKDKASFILAGRRSYIDVLAKPFLKGELKDSKLYFYDLTAKVNYKLNDNNRIFLSGYFGKDAFGGSATIFGFNWGNATSTLRWNHVFNQKLFFNFTTFYSKYDYFLLNGKSETDGFEWNSSIVNYSVKPEFVYYPNPDNTTKFGTQSLFYDFTPGDAKVIISGKSTDIKLEDKFALESSLFIENEQKLSNSLSINYGLRYSQYQYLGKGKSYHFKDGIAGERKTLSETKTYKSGEKIEQYGNFEPRFALKYQLNQNSSVKASYNRMAQYIHLISNTAASLPVDVWTPSTNNIKPQLADQVALGYFRNFGKEEKTLETSVEVYYKKLQNQIDYIDGANLLLNEFLEADLMNGKGRAYGVEFQVKKNYGALTGWVSYTLARTERQVEGINKGLWYPTRFDKLHNLNITAAYQVSNRVSFSGNFVFNSGTPATFPTNRIETNGWVIPHNSEERRNNYRIPDYHRLDISVTLQQKPKANKKREGNWVFSLYNVYNRQNPFAVFFQTNKDNAQKTEAINYSIIGSVIPGVTYNFKF
jgi:TonB dependent receptor/CarboxypepD_reg-like domain/TonB-dependent Receptor Plug Domain